MSPMQMRLDLDAKQALALLPVVDEATARLIRTVHDEQLHPQQPSALAGWTIANVLSHLWYGAVASLRMTRQVIDGHAEVDFYPGGADEREASIRSGDGYSREELVQRLQQTSSQLTDAWKRLDQSDWQRTFVEPRLGPIALTRLVILRLTELEVHHTDLGAGYAHNQWDPTFVAYSLPLRVAWLPRHHRVRADADLTVNGRWNLRVQDGQGWVVQADGERAEVVPGHSRHDPVIQGTPAQLLALLLGRPAGIEPTQEIHRFKQAFPGP